MVSIQSKFNERYYDDSAGEWKDRVITRYLGLDNKLFPKKYRKPRFTTERSDAAYLCSQEWCLAKDEISKENRQVVLV